MGNLSSFNFIQTTPICLSDAVLLRRIKSGKMRIDATGCIEKRCAKCRDYWPQGRTPVVQPFSGDCSLLYQLPVKQKSRHGVCA